MSSLSFPAQAALFRRARRLAVRSPLRTLWTGFLVFLAVAAGVALMSRTWGHYLHTQSVEGAFGAADAVYSGSAPSPEAVTAASESLQGQLPAGSTMATEQVTEGGIVVAAHSTESATEASGSVAASVSEAHLADWSNPLLRGVVRLIDGRLPKDGEAVITPDVARQTGLDVGDDMELLGSVGSLRVVGIATIGNFGAPAFATTPASLRPVSGSVGGPSVGVRMYASVPAGAQVPVPATTPGGIGGTVLLGQPAVRDAAHTAPGAFVGVPGATAPVWTLIAFLAGIVGLVGLLAGAAFGIGASRRMRATGLLSANGADRAQLAASAASEAVVVALPASVVAVGAVVAVDALWARFKLPGWVAMLDASIPPIWALLAVVAAVVAAAVGAVLFSRSVRRLSSSALLDGRGVGGSGTAHGRRPERLAWYGWLGLGVMLWIGWYATVGFVATRRTAIGSLAAGVAVVLWAACAFGALRIVRLVLRRDPIGRLVDRDLRRRRVGSTAAILVVATWVFLAVTATATDWFTAFGTERPDSVAVTSGQPATPTTTGVTSESVPTISVPEPSGAVLISPPVGDTNTGGVRTLGWVVAGQKPSTTAIPRAAVPLVTTVPDGIAADLADSGLSTHHAVLGTWTGPCPVCPSGFTPTALVLDSAVGIGLPQSTVDLLQQGFAVTSFDVDGVEDQRVAGVGVRVGDVPLGASAVVLASSIVDGSNLSNPQGVLVGDSTGLSDEQAAKVLGIVRSAGLQVDSRTPRLSQVQPDDGTPAPADPPADWVVWPWLVVLLGVTLVATAAHRREHSEAARVLRVIGANPRSGRRLVSLTAGSLAGVGVGMGLTAAFVVLVVTAARHGSSAPGSGGIGFDFDRLWNRQASMVLLAALVVPVVVALLARLIPPYRAVGGPDGPMPS